MRVVSASEIDRLLTFPRLVDALDQAFRAGAHAPERHHHAIGAGEGAVHLLMPAWTTDAPAPGSFLGTKLVNIFRGNAAKGLPAVLGTYVLCSGETGQPLAAMDGTRLTHWRTAAASALAARYLARPDARHLVMVGAGALAPFLIRAHASVRPIERVTLWNHRRESAERLAGQMSEWPVTVADDLEAAVREADIVSCATLATAPVVHGTWLPPGVHVDLVGGFTMGMREVDDEALRRCRVFVDTEVALTEGGDVAIGIRDGAIRTSDVQATLFDLTRQGNPGRRSTGEMTLFKSVGTALEDLAAAMAVWSALPEERIASEPKS